MVSHAFLRSIPACTGEPADGAAGRMGSGVYPRVYGGTRQLPTHVQALQGLSPRVRGNRGRERAQPALRGSIPACTGEPKKGFPYIMEQRVYPRVYGGTRTCCTAAVRPAGLSPRVRGNPPPAFRARPRARSIPACTGEPRVAPGAGIGVRVYPRVYGGTRHRAVNHAGPQGLSPRVRGNPRSGTRGIVYLWSIPACTGEPFHVAIRW